MTETSGGGREREIYVINSIFHFFLCHIKNENDKQLKAGGGVGMCARSFVFVVVDARKSPPHSPMPSIKSSQSIIALMTGAF